MNAVSIDVNTYAPPRSAGLSALGPTIVPGAVFLVAAAVLISVRYDGIYLENVTAVLDAIADYVSQKQSTFVGKLFEGAPLAVAAAVSAIIAIAGMIMACMVVGQFLTIIGTIICERLLGRRTLGPPAEKLLGQAQHRQTMLEKSQFWRTHLLIFFAGAIVVLWYGRAWEWYQQATVLFWAAALHIILVKIPATVAKKIGRKKNESKFFAVLSRFEPSLRIPERVQTSACAFVYGLTRIVTHPLSNDLGLHDGLSKPTRHRLIGLFYRRHGYCWSEQKFLDKHEQAQEDEPIPEHVYQQPGNTRNLDELLAVLHIDAIANLEDVKVRMGQYFFNIALYRNLAASAILLLSMEFLIQLEAFGPIASPSDWTFIILLGIYALLQIRHYQFAFELTKEVLAGMIAIDQDLAPNIMIPPRPPQDPQSNGAREPGGDPNSDSPVADDNGFESTSL